MRLLPGSSRFAVARFARGESPPRERSPVKVWYGLPILAIDVSAVAIAHVGLFAKAPALIYIGGGAYLVGGPIVHIVHGSGLRALGSFGLRAALPTGLGLLGALVGYELFGGSNNNNTDGYGPLVGLVLGGYAGGMSGIVAASSIDIAALANEEVATPPPQGGWTLRPNTSFVRDAQNARTPVLGVAGSF